MSKCNIATCDKGFFFSKSMCYGESAPTAKVIHKKSLPIIQSENSDTTSSSKADDANSATNFSIDHFSRQCGLTMLPTLLSHTVT